MKDIDFDELDKAVSGVLGTTKPAETSITTAEESKTDTVLVTSHQSTIAAEPVALAATPTISVSSPAVRRGRFMDVVHPSSDMTSPGAPSKEIIAPSSRKLAPISSDIAPKTTPTAIAPEAVMSAAEDEPKLDTIETPHATPTEVQKPEADTLEKVAPPAPLVEAVPPIEVTPIADGDNDETSAGTMPEDKNEVEEPKSDESETEPETANDEFSDLTVDKVIESRDDAPSPFLTDTKVDKRPLGGFDAEGAAVADEPLPQELNTEVLNVESKEATESTRANEDVLQSPENRADDAQLKHMFDSESYQAPLVAHKRSSGIWLWVVLILVLLAVGSGLGYLWFVNGY